MRSQQSWMIHRNRNRKTSHFVAQAWHICLRDKSGAIPRAARRWLITPVHFSYAAHPLEQALPLLVLNSSSVTGLSSFPCWQPGSFCYSEVACSARHWRRLNFLLTQCTFFKCFFRKGGTHVNLAGQLTRSKAKYFIRSSEVLVAQP